MKISLNSKKSFIYASTFIAGITAIAGGIIIRHDNSAKNNYQNRLENMEYIKHNAPQKYTETLEIINKSNSPRITPEYIDNIWQISAAAVKDSIELTKKN